VDNEVSKEKTPSVEGQSAALSLKAKGSTALWQLSQLLGTTCLKQVSSVLVKHFHQLVYRGVTWRGKRSRLFIEHKLLKT